MSLGSDEMSLQRVTLLPSWQEQPVFIQLGEKIPTPLQLCIPEGKRDDPVVRISFVRGWIMLALRDMDEGTMVVIPSDKCTPLVMVVADDVGM